MREPPSDVPQKCVIQMRTGHDAGTRRMALAPETCAFLRPGKRVGCGGGVCVFERRGYPKQILKFAWRESEFAVAQHPKLRGLVPRVRAVVKIDRPPSADPYRYSDGDFYYAAIMDRASPLKDDERHYLQRFRDIVDNTSDAGLTRAVKAKIDQTCDRVHPEDGTPAACKTVAREWLGLLERIEERGFYPADLHYANLGRIKGKLVAIDSGEFRTADDAAPRPRVRNVKQGRSLNRFRRT